jgi:hypothetical protein
MPSRGVRLLPVATMTAGGILIWSGLYNRPVADILRTLATGAAPQPGPPENYVSSQAGAASPGSSAPGDTGASTANAAANQAIARLLAAPYGWSAGTQWEDLVSLWNRESGWNQYAKNPSSGAYGIAQALPPEKYPPAGQESGGSSPSAQISWGLSYIKAVYGSPAAAWAHETSYGWY